MKKLFTLLVVAFLIAPASGQTFADASITLKEAAHAEMVSGDLDLAISLYRQVAETVSASREDVAKALVALGRSYEMIGSDEAVTVYNRLVTEFPDQADAFIAAHKALGRYSDTFSDGFVNAPGQDYKLMLDNASFGVGYSPFGREHDISPDGSTIVFATEALPYRKQLYPDLENELYFVKSGGSILEPVIKDANDWVGAFLGRWLPRWSPDGQQILFRAARTGSSELVFARQDLKLNKTFLLPNVSVRGHLTWMPDSKRFISVAKNGFDLYSREGTLIRHFDTGKDRNRLGSVSPDGRYLAYLKHNSDGAGSRFNFNVWLLDLRSAAHIQITNDDGNKGIPTWSSDSKSVLYSSLGVLYKHSLNKNDAREQLTSYENASVSHPVVLAGTGQLTYALSYTNETVLVAPSKAPNKAREVAQGSYPMLSPDGKKIYFWRHKSGEEGLWSKTLDGREPEHLMASDAAEISGYQVSLSPDGRQIAYFLTHDDISDLYVLPVRGGAPKKLYSAQEGVLRPGWSPDSREIAFADGSDLMVISGSGGPAQSIAQAVRWQSDDIRWSPDGKYVAGFAYFQDWDSPKRFNNVLIAINRRTKEVKRLTPADDSYREGLSWHPDSKHISYLVGGPTKAETRFASLNGKIETLVKSSARNHWIGLWGPDSQYYYLYGYGKGLSVVTERGSTSEIAVKPKDDRVLWFYPTWSRDGSVMAWSESSSNVQLWMVTDF